MCGGGGERGTSSKYIVEMMQPRWYTNVIIMNKLELTQMKVETWHSPKNMWDTGLVEKK